MTHRTSMYKNTQRRHWSFTSEILSRQLMAVLFLKKIRGGGDVGWQKKFTGQNRNQGRAPSSFSVLQLAGETAQHDLDLRHPKLPVNERSDHAGSFSCLIRCTRTHSIGVHMVLSTKRFTIWCHRMMGEGRGGEGQGTGAPHIQSSSQYQKLKRQGISSVHVYQHFAKEVKDQKGGAKFWQDFKLGKASYGQGVVPSFSLYKERQRAYRGIYMLKNRSCLAFDTDAHSTKDHTIAYIYILYIQAGQLVRVCTIVYHLYSI